jgi:2-methylfumaryl-CoA hydratase
MKGRDGNFFEDFRPGQKFRHATPRTLGDGDCSLYIALTGARLYQNNARVHFDALAMKDSQFGRRLVYGGHVISLCRALSHDGLENALLIAAINGGTHANPVFAGDTLYAASEILEKWALPGHDDLGALRLRLLGVKNCRADELAAPKSADGRYDPRVALDLDYTVLMPRRKKS